MDGQTVFKRSAGVSGIGCGVGSELQRGGEAFGERFIKAMAA